MNTEEIRTAVVHALAKIAPETDPATVDADADLRDALDIDSMDFLGFVTQIHDALHVDIPERDYPKVRTLRGCVTYLAAQLDGRRVPS